MSRRRSGRVLALLAACLALGGCPIAERLVDAKANRVSRPAPDAAATPAEQPDFEAFFRSLLIVDLHADTLLWNRDLPSGEGRGHIDLPRLCDANVAVLVFTIVTEWAPASSGGCHTGGFNAVGVLSALHYPDWPGVTLVDLAARADVQTEEFARFGAESNGRLRPIRNASDLSTVIGERSRAPGCVVGGILGVEGLHFVATEPAAGIDRLARQGVRIASLTHHFDNRLAGSSTGCGRYGVMDEGRATLERMREQAMIIDLAHASPLAIDDVLAWRRQRGDTRPFFVSHTGVEYPTCENDPRNLSAQQVRALTRDGGVIGVMFWDQQVCRKGKDANAVLDGVIAAFNGIDDALQGVVADPRQHMALGSDFDGGIVSPFDVRGLRRLIARLRAETDVRSGVARRRYSDDDIRNIAGLNACRVLAAVLPREAADESLSTLCSPSPSGVSK